MKSHETRLQRLEIACWRRSVAQAVQGTPFGVDDVLEQAIAFLETPMAQRMRDYPAFTEAEHATMETWLPAIRLAYRRRPPDWP
jgi:hypothetical protein